MNWGPEVVSLQLRKIFAYRSDFWINFLAQALVQLFVARALWLSVFAVQGTSELEGFTLPMLTLYYLLSPIGFRILQGEGAGFLSKEIYEGTFTRYLLYPLSFFSYKSLTYLTQSAFYCVQMILIYGLYQMIFGVGFTVSSVGNLFLGVSLFFASAMVYLTLSFLVELLALWADNVWALTVTLRFVVNFFGGGVIPLAFFPVYAQKILHYTPFPHIMSLPIRTIMGMNSSAEIIEGSLLLLFWGIVLGSLARGLWGLGEKKYTGVGI